jgi:hypothetical protein
MTLVSQRTNLKSLRYGQDRPGGGDSGQPYIQTPISGGLLGVNIGNLNVSIPIPNLGILGRSTGGEDFLLRGGTQTPSRILKDVSRLSKMFLDTKSPKGVLFTIKQNLLSRAGTKTQASGLLNEGIYTPLSTLGQAIGNPFGIHLNKQGLNPFRDTSPDARAIRSPWGLPVYSQTVKFDEDKNENRLVQLTNAKFPTAPPPPNIFNLVAVRSRGGRRVSFPKLQFSTSPRNQISNNLNEILKYGGGPGSILGVGFTTLKRYSFTDEGRSKAFITQPSSKNVYGKTFFENITPTQTSLNIATASTLGSVGLKASTTGVNSLRNSYLYTNTSQGEIRANLSPKEKKSVFGKTFFPNISPTLTLRAGVFAFGNAYRSN